MLLKSQLETGCFAASLFMCCGGSWVPWIHFLLFAFMFFCFFVIPPGPRCCLDLLWILLVVFFLSVDFLSRISALRGEIFLRTLSSKRPEEPQHDRQG